jgi:hypothetical protein
VSEDAHAPLVNAVIRQIEDSLESDRILNRQWWNWSIFITKAARYRFVILILYALSAMKWLGNNNVLSFTYALSDWHYQSPRSSWLESWANTSLLALHLNWGDIYG